MAGHSLVWFLIMNKYSYFLIALGLSPYTYASENPCITGTVVKQMQCLDQAIIKEHRIRESWLTKLEKQVEVKQNNTGNTQLFLSFQRGKNSFATYISDNCQWRYLNELPNSSKAALEYKRCELFITKQQINVLKGGY